MQIASGDTKSWLLRFTRQGKAREMGLGAADPDGRMGVSLSQARQLAAAARRQLQAGLDPIAERDKAALERRKAEERGKDQTFRKAAEGYIAAHRAGWKSAKHADQWGSTLEAYVYPALGGMDVANVTVADVLGVLKPIWQKTPETASRVRQRIEAILDYAAAPSRGWRSSENSARWRGLLEHELPPTSKVRRVHHYPSLPWQQIKGFMAALDEHEGVAAQALKFSILTACRSGEVRGAVWNEIDLEKATWTIPANRMKAGKLHRVALSKSAIKILEARRQLSSGKPKDLIFASPASTRTLSDMALSQLVRGMSSDGLGKGDLPRWRDSENRAVVVHGFRSTFKSWALSTSYPDHLSEIALSHSDKNKVRAAYAREDLLDGRRPLMDAWGKVCTSSAAAILDMRSEKMAHLDLEQALQHVREGNSAWAIRYTPQEIVSGLRLELAPASRPKKSRKSSEPRLDVQRGIGDGADDVLTPKAAENPVVAALKARALYKTPLGSGKHDVTCPWTHEHTDQIDHGAAYFEPDELYSVGGFCCQHTHRAKYHVRELLEFLGIRNAEARHKPVIRIIAGDLHRVVDALEKELAGRDRHYQAGGLIVSIATDPTSGDPSVVPTSVPALTRELSVAATFEKYDGRAEDWVRCDPPVRHTGILFDSQRFRYLPPLVGLARQPYFRETDGELICQPGYDKVAQRFGVFNARQFVIPDPTPDEARAALKLLEDLLTEFSFVSATDKSAALAAIFTAVVRPSLPYAPAFHVRAPVFGSGKTYMCEVIGAFAGPGGNSKVSYPTTSEEATKVVLSLLLTSPACVEFDDMDTDWIPHGTIKRMLTAETITDRILGVSKTATVSTRALFLGSGNNVGPIRDLLRRVLTIHIDPRCATPATKAYRGAPVDKVRQNRGAYVSAVLTVIQAWRRAGSPRAKADSIANYSGPWSDYCRYPLMWLGHPDPATALLDQVRHDHDADALYGLMTEWHAVFGSTPTTVRKAVEIACYDNNNLLDAIREFPVEERGDINRSKLGWFLKKNANRIVGGFEFQQAEADGRTAWRVVAVNSPPSPPLPTFKRLVNKTVTQRVEISKQDGRDLV